MDGRDRGIHLVTRVTVTDLGPRRAVNTADRPAASSLADPAPHKVGVTADPPDGRVARLGCAGFVVVFAFAFAVTAGLIGVGVVLMAVFR